MTSTSEPLKPINDNIQLPMTPGKQVRVLRTELEKKDAENEALHNKINELTNALTSLSVVKGNVIPGTGNTNDAKKKQER